MALFCVIIIIINNYTLYTYIHTHIYKWNFYLIKSHEEQKKIEL